MDFVQAGQKFGFINCALEITLDSCEANKLACQVYPISRISLYVFVFTQKSAKQTNKQTKDSLAWTQTQFYLANWKHSMVLC